MCSRRVEELGLVCDILVTSSCLLTLIIRLGLKERDRLATQILRVWYQLYGMLVCINLDIKYVGS